MTERERYVLHCLTEMQKVLKEYEEWHNRQLLTRFMRWLRWY